MATNWASICQARAAALSAFYDKIYGEGRWVGQTIISDAIGQGEILATPLQIANLSATIANRGYYITPHVVKHIQGVGVLKKNLERHDTDIEKAYYEDIVTGMRMAVLGGTCTRANIPGLDVCGKTGTAQNPHGRDHSIFMGFAPMNDPKIAVCVYVENAGFGAAFGVPIGALMIQRYLRGDSPGLQAQGRAMASRHTIAYPKAKKTTASGTRAADNKTQPSKSATKSDGNKE